jgi:CheY-like chemotaxis protein
VSQGKILIVDDEELVGMFFKRVLQESGYEVKVAQSGREALELARKERFDIVYTDLVMPEMNGVEVCKQIKKLNPKTEVIMISGHPAQIGRYVLPFFEAGGQDKILRKPVSEEEILEVAAKAMKEISKR